MRRRCSTLELASFFFKPVQLHLQTSDLAIQLVFARLGVGRLRVRLARKDLGQPFGHLFLPLAHLHGMHLVLRRNGMHRLDALQGFETNLSFEFWTMLASFLGHLDRSGLSLDLTIPAVQFSGSTSPSRYLALYNDSGGL